MAIIVLILKNLPLILSIFGGLFAALNRLAPKDKPLPVDLDAVKALVEKATLEQISKVVEEHKKEIIPWVPNEEQKARDERAEDLMKELERAQEEYERERREKEALAKLDRL